MAIEPYYESDGITIYCERCEDVIPTLPAGSIDLVVTSPPYNLGNTTGGGVKALGHYRKTDGMQKRGGSIRSWRSPALMNGYGDCDDNMPHAEYVAWQHDVLRALWPLLSDTGAIFYNHKPRILNGRLIPAMAYVPPDLVDQVRQEVVWARAGGINHTEAFYCNTHERIVVIARDAFRLTGKAASSAGDVWYIPQERNNPHPAPFPLGVPMRAIETTPARTVLDPFCGSGTTLVAAKLRGRVATGIELSEEYCRDAAVRLERTQPRGTMAVPLFGLVTA